MRVRLFICNNDVLRCGDVIDWCMERIGDCGLRIYIQLPFYTNIDACGFMYMKYADCMKISGF